MNRKIAILSLAVLTVLAVTAGTVSAASNNTSNKTKVATSAKARPTLTTEQKAAMEAKQAEMKVKFEAVQAAITAGDYQAWVTAQKALDENCPILSKITADNFSRYIESYKLRQQAEAIDKELGIERGGQFGEMGFGPGRGHGRGEQSQTEAVTTK